MDQERYNERFEHVGESMRKIVKDLPDVDPKSAAVFLEMMDAMQLFGKFHAQRLNQTGLPASQAGCLMFIGVFEGLSQRELATKLGVASSSATVMLQRMEKAGLIERKPDETDQRILRVTLSAQGREMLKCVKRSFADFINNTIGSISDRGIEAILIVIDELNESIHRAKEAK